MTTDKIQVESIVQNLKDAGCEPETVVLFLQMREDGKASDQLCLLAKHRKKLLDDIHGEQAKMDCLDFLIYQMKKEQAVC